MSAKTTAQSLDRWLVSRRLFNRSAMSPTRSTEGPAPAVRAALRSFYALFGARINDARRDRRWSVAELAQRAGLSRGLVYMALRGEQVSLEAGLRMAGALGLKLDWDLVDARRRAERQVRWQDPVHSAMGELEAANLRPFGYGLAIDEPYQHYQFAGRADLAAWDLDGLALLHIENRTRFPDLQETAGSYNAKRAYLGKALAERLGIRGWRSETHVIVALWSAEVLHSLRIRTETFRVLCPDGPKPFNEWWSGRPPPSGKTSALFVLDPLATGRQRRIISLDDALTARTRHRGYADVASGLLDR